MTQKKKSRIAGALEASILEEMMDDSGHQVQFSKFCLKHYLNQENMNLEKTAMLCENFSANHKLHEWSMKVLRDNPIDEETRMVMLDEDDMFIMETLVLTVVALKADLKRFANITLEKN